MSQRLTFLWQAERERERSASGLQSNNSHVTFLFGKIHSGLIISVIHSASESAAVKVALPARGCANIQLCDLVLEFIREDVLSLL